VSGDVVPLSDPCFGGNEWNYVKECIDTAWVSSVGSFVDRFERDVARSLGRKFAIATASGTAALHVALLAAGIGPDEEVVVSSLSFIAPANAIRYVGAYPIFLDAEPDHWQMDVAKLESFLATECVPCDGGLSNRTSGRPVKAVLPVDILGHPCDMDAIVEVAHRRGLMVIEDAAESLGAKYKGSSVGTRGIAACLSFNGNKIITAGGGGMIITDDETFARRARYLSTQAKDDPVEYVHREIGFNYRLSNLQAAVGCAQLERLEAHVAVKREIAERYRQALSDVPGVFPMREAAWATSTFWLYTILVDRHAYGMDSRELMQRLAREGIRSRPLWQPLHQSPAHAGSRSCFCETAERLNRDALSLPSSVGLSASQQEKVISCIARNRR